MALLVIALFTTGVKEKTMSKYAIINNNVVENIIEAEQDFIDAHYPGAVLLQDNEVAGPGWTVENGEYKGPDLIVSLEELLQETPAIEE
jgi:hypothetical protein